MNKSHDRSEEARRAALGELERLRHGGDALGGSFAGLRGCTAPPADRDRSDQGDAVELWGRRIGQALSAVAVVALGIYLFSAYVR